MNDVFNSTENTTVVSLKQKILDESQELTLWIETYRSVT